MKGLCKFHKADGVLTDMLMRKGRRIKEKAVIMENGDSYLREVKSI